MESRRRRAEGYAIPLIERIVEKCPERVCGNGGERRAQRMLREEFEELGLETKFHRFRFNRSIYANFALHFGLVTVGSVLYVQSAVAALFVYLVAGVSYLYDSERRFFVLRRLFPHHESQNLVARVPSEGEPSRRIVVVGHADAAFTGRIFEPDRVKAAHEFPDLIFDLGSKPIRLGTVATGLLVALALAATLLGASIWWSAGVAVATIPPLLITLFNLEVVLRDEIVPGANDNLSGCAATIMLADRLADEKPDDVELVFVATGAEEAGGGGSYALARDRLGEGEWDPDRTVVVGLDGMTNGELRYFREAEVLPTPVPESLADALEEPPFDHEGLESHEIPAGATDVMSFLGQGYRGVCLGCVDPEFGSPRHYHHPTDTPKHLDPEQFDRSVDFAESLLRWLM